jgi:broad specificity phosphatase PhoE
MRKLILVRHSQSRQDPSRPASQWELTEEGRRRCTALAEQLATYRVDLVVTSHERKAIETGSLAAARLGVPVEVAASLHEHERERAAFVPAADFEHMVANFFARPDKLVFGEETARQAGDRFDRAVRSVLEQHAAGNVAIVAHGTVMSLFIARYNQVDAAQFWQRLGMPAAVVLAAPGFKILEIAELVAPRKSCQ